jgi:hypothetical protein
MCFYRGSLHFWTDEDNDPALAAAFLPACPCSCFHPRGMNVVASAIPSQRAFLRNGSTEQIRTDQFSSHSFLIKTNFRFVTTTGLGRDLACLRSATMCSSVICQEYHQPSQTRGWLARPPIQLASRSPQWCPRIPVIFGLHGP